MSAFFQAVRWDMTLQARNGFYWASAFLVIVVAVLLLYVPEEVTAQPAVWVPAVLTVNLQITTFFFVAALILLERDEGTLQAVAVSPCSPSQYLAMRILTLTALGAVETLAIVWIGFGADGWRPLILAGTLALGLIYTGLGAAVAARYESINTLLLPASAFVTLLLLPLLPHFGLVPRAPFLLHPIEPVLALLRTAYGVTGGSDVVYGVVGSAGWSGVAFVWGRNGVHAVMHDTRAAGGR
jgi:fluoroquinolone transport system permease protein